MGGEGPLYVEVDMLLVRGKKKYFFGVRNEHNVLAYGVKTVKSKKKGMLLITVSKNTHIGLGILSNSVLVIGFLILLVSFHDCGLWIDFSVACFKRV